MTINKAHFSVDNSGVKLSMPIAKVDEERRVVSGFASLDNVDKQDDIVTKDASINAFKNFAGNIREQHDHKKAVGKMVSFEEDTYFDPETSKMYNGVYVSAYISKGAQDTWEKVLDGTLTGFSIGGEINEDDTIYDAELEKSIRVIKDFSLTELSLVDVPANQFANVLSIQKNGEMTGMLAKALIENVYYCGHDDVVQLSSTVKTDCPRCSGSMENIGFVESNDPDKAQMIKGILTTVRKNKEVEDMSENTEETTPETPEAVEEAVEAIEETVEEVKAEVEETVAEVTEEITEDKIETVEMKIEALATAVAGMTAQIAEIKSLADAVTKVYSQVGEISKAVATLNSDLTSLKTNDQEFGKRVDAVEKETAFRKSADYGEVMQDQPEMVEKSLWGGRFLKKSDLF